MDKTIDIAKEISEHYCKISEESILLLASILDPIKIRKGINIVSENEICKYIYYIKKGLLRQYYIKNGKEVTEHIAHEGNVVICIESFFKQEPSRLMVQSLEPSVVYGIPYKGLDEITKQSYEICKLKFAILEQSLINSQIKADILRFETAHERYTRTLNTEPEIIKRAPLHHVASYLQMTPETLSRVRTASNTKVNLPY